MKKTYLKKERAYLITQYSISKLVSAGNNQYAALLLSYFLAINAPFLIALSTTREI